MGCITYANDLYNDDEIYHHGVKGMRWGVRRYQNEDGTLTTVGKKRQQNKEFRKDRSRLKAAIREGKIATDWSKAYGKALEGNDELVSKRIKSDYKKYGESSGETKNLSKLNKQLHKEQESYNKKVSESIAEARSIANEMRKKYGDRKIKDIKTHTRDGQEFVSGILRGHRGKFKVEKISYVNQNHQKEYEYVRSVTRRKWF